MSDGDQSLVNHVGRRGPRHLTLAAPSVAKDPHSARASLELRVNIEVAKRGGEWAKVFTTRINTWQASAPHCSGTKAFGLPDWRRCVCGISVEGSSAPPLIPAVAGLTERVTSALRDRFGTVLNALIAEMASANIETLLSRVRSFSSVTGKTVVHGFDGDG